MRKGLIIVKKLEFGQSIQIHPGGSSIIKYTSKRDSENLDREREGKQGEVQTSMGLLPQTPVA